MIRAFVGLPVPREIARDLEAAQAGLPVGNPVASENFHITLAFLGEHQSPVIEDVHHALTPIVAPEVAIDISGLGTFGNAAPRILFAGVQPSPALGELRKKVRRAAREAGAELAVVVVDEAVLALTSYQLPDPLSVFYRPMSSQLSTTYLRDTIELTNPDLLATEPTSGAPTAR